MADWSGLGQRLETERRMAHTSQGPRDTQTRWSIEWEMTGGRGNNETDGRLVGRFKTFSNFVSSSSTVRPIAIAFWGGSIGSSLRPSGSQNPFTTNQRGRNRGFNPGSRCFWGPGESRRQVGTLGGDGDPDDEWQRRAMRWSGPKSKQWSNRDKR